jgi:hypothetical protein
MSNSLTFDNIIDKMKDTDINEPVKKKYVVVKKNEIEIQKKKILTENDNSPDTETHDKKDIDNILNNDIIKFDNKNQKSMYFIACKTVNYMYNELEAKYNIKLPPEIYKSVISEVIPNFVYDYTSNLKRRCKNVCSEMICLGRKLDNKQCSRKKVAGQDFCKSHMKNLSNGRVDQSNNEVKIIKRGRKPKVQFDPRRFDNEYLTLWEDIIDGERILLDNANNIYTFDEKHPIFIGKKDVNNNLNIREIITKLKKNNNIIS